MKFTLNTLGCPGWTLERAACAAREYGYDGVDLRLLDGEVATPELIWENRERIRRLFGPNASDRLPITVLATSAHFSMTDGSERGQNEALVRQYIDLAAELAIPVVRVFGGKRPPGVDVPQSIENVAQSLNRLVREAERAGVVVSLETHDDFSSAIVVAEVLKRAPSLSIGATWDLHHTYHAGERNEEVWQLIGSRTVNVHVKDARRNPESRAGWDLVLLGEGEVPIKHGLQLLRERGYAGYVSVEWEKKWHPELPEPEIAFPQHISLMRTYLAETAERLPSG